MGLFGPPNIEKLKAKKNVKGLIKALQYKNKGKVRRQAAEALGELGDVNAVESLIQALKDEYVRWETANALAKIGEPAVEPLIQALKNEDSNVRLGAARALGYIGNARAVEPLIQSSKDNDPDVRREAVACLGKIGDAEVQALIKATIDDQYRLKSAASEALEKIGEPAVKPLVQALEDVRSLEDIDIRSLKGLQSLEGKDPLLKKKILRKGVIIETLGAELIKIGDERAVKPLIHALKDESSNVRKMAAEVLGHIGDAKAVEPLIQSLKDEDGVVRWKAAKALAKIGEPAVRLLIQALKDEDEHVREGTARALRKIGDKKAVEPIAQLLGDEHEGVRKEAARALGKMGDIRAAEGIISELFLSVQSRSNLFQVLFSDYGNVSYEEFSEQLWPRLMKNLFGDYTSFILRASDEPTSTREITYKGHSGEDQGRGHYYFSEIDDAIHELCKIHTQIATNILHKVSKRRDIEVVLSWDCSGGNRGQLSFKSQREMAREELERRGNPPYDPSAYLGKEAWKL